MRRQEETNMAKVVKVNGTLLGLPDKNWTLIDSNTNTKKFIKNFMGWNEKILDIDDSPIEMMQLIVDEVPNILEDMLDLTKTERKKIDDASFSDQYDIFREMVRAFLGIEMASISENEVDEDPKGPVAEWISNSKKWVMILIIWRNSY